MKEIFQIIKNNILYIYNMEFNYDKKRNMKISNMIQNISPISVIKKPVPNIENPNYYGKSPYPMSYEVSSRKNDKLQYNNTLDITPGSCLNYLKNKKKEIEPFMKKSCYLINSKNQGVNGIICNPDKSNNANYIRGNQFSSAYNEINEYKKKEYTVEQPVQSQMILENPVMVNNNSIFYPNPYYFLTRSKKYDTYPKENNMTKRGIPYYTNHNNTLNLYNEYENFINLNKKDKENILNFIIIILSFLVLFIIFYLTNR